MTCPDLDRLVDAAVAGLPGADARLAEHADACAACLAEADCEHSPVPEMAMLADATCPPDVLAAALAAARGTSDRDAAPFYVRLASDRPADPAAARPSARPVWSRRIAVGIAFAAALLVLRAAWPDQRPETPQVATMPDVPASSQPPGSDGGTTPQPVEVAAVPEPVAPQIAAQPVAPRPAVTRPSPRIAPGPRTRTEDPVPGSTPVVVPPTIETAVPDDEVASISPADSVAARSDLLLALAIVGRAQRTADTVVSVEMRRVSDALEPARTL